MRCELTARIYWLPVFTLIMAASPLIVKEGENKSDEPQITTISGFPTTLTLKGPRVVLKTPTPADDAVMSVIFSDPLTMKHLPSFTRPEGWTMEDMAVHRETVAHRRLQGTGLTVFIHLPAKKDGSASEDAEEKMVLAGTTGFVRSNLGKGTSEIGIILHHLYWRQGVATEAMYLCLRYGFETIGFNRVDWVTSVDNQDMRGWCEGLLKMEPYDPKLEDEDNVVGYSLHRSEWDTRVSQFLEQIVSSRKNRCDKEVSDAGDSSLQRKVVS